MNVRLSNARVEGEIKAIPSKSYAHRISICNFLAGQNPSADCGEFSSKDIAATEGCLNALINGKNTLDCGESGSTLRFLIPLVASIGGEYELVGQGRLMDRPNEELFSVLQKHGVSAVKTDKIRISGKLSWGEYQIRGDISSQYITGLLMALPLLEEDSKIVLSTPLYSAPYVDITLEVLQKYGVKIDKTPYGFYVYGGQKFSGKIIPEGDWSNAAFFLVAACAVGKSITVSGLNKNSVQGDRRIVDVLKAAGADISWQGDKLVVNKSSLNGFCFDANDCPDLVPIAAVLAAYANGKTVIKNIQRLKIKESDRVQTTIDMLGAFNIKAESDGQDLTVYGGKVLGGKTNSYNDHRIAMSAAVLALGADGESEIIDAGAVAKSYPNFFEHYNRLGGKAYVL